MLDRTGAFLSGRYGNETSNPLDMMSPFSAFLSSLFRAVVVGISPPPLRSISSSTVYTRNRRQAPLTSFFSLVCVWMEEGEKARVRGAEPG